MTTKDIKEKGIEKKYGYDDYRWEYMSFDFYEIPEEPEKWNPCPECGLRPKIYEFDNGRFAHCICGESRYKHKHEVSAKPIGDYVRETGGFSGFDRDELRRNWNNYINQIKK
jgi:hypothetical protein